MSKEQQPKPRSRSKAYFVTGMLGWVFGLGWYVNDNLAFQGSVKWQSVEVASLRHGDIYPIPPAPPLPPEVLAFVQERE